MQMHTFVADSAADAVAQIRRQLGPQAVVVNVRRKAVTGIGRLFKQERIEVEAGVPDPEPAVDPLAEIKLQLAEIRQQMETRESRPERTAPLDSPLTFPTSPEAPVTVQITPEFSTELPSAPPERTFTPKSVGGVRMLLENTGLLPLYAASLVEELRLAQRGQPIPSVPQEIDSVCNLLKRRWRPPPQPAHSARNVHIFIGPAGSGKTTCLCKWLARSVLLENRLAHVWRLDGVTANAAESLSLYAEILGVSVHRFLSEESVVSQDDLLFVDLPGVNWQDRSALESLATQLKELPKGHVHLVLNTAYETKLLLNQARAFSAFPVTDLVLTHLDEETQGGKLWNLVLGTNFSIGFLSAGQNIPGDLQGATPELIFQRQFPANRGIHHD